MELLHALYRVQIPGQAINGLFILYYNGHSVFPENEDLYAATETKWRG